MGSLYSSAFNKNLVKHSYQKKGFYFAVNTFEDEVLRNSARQKLYCHDHFEIFLFHEGNGKISNSLITFPILEFSIICISPGQLHEWSNCEKLKGIVFSFSQNFFDDDKNIVKIYEMPFFYTEDQFHIKTSFKEYNRLLELFNIMIDEISLSNFKKYELIKSTLECILIRLQRFANTNIQSNYLNPPLKSRSKNMRI